MDWAALSTISINSSSTLIIFHDKLVTVYANILKKSSSRTFQCRLKYTYIENNAALLSELNLFRIPNSKRCFSRTLTNDEAISSGDAYFIWRQSFKSAGKISNFLPAKRSNGSATTSSRSPLAKKKRWELGPGLIDRCPRDGLGNLVTRAPGPRSPSRTTEDPGSGQARQSCDSRVRATAGAHLFLRRIVALSHYFYFNNFMIPFTIRQSSCLNWCLYDIWH